MKKYLAACVLGLSLVGTPASASPECNGCNIVDDGWFGRSLIGSLVYYEVELGEYRAARVRDIDPRTKKILWDNGGYSQWSSAYNFYTATSRDERIGNMIAGAGTVLLVCMFAPDACK